MSLCIHRTDNILALFVVTQWPYSVHAFYWRLTEIAAMHKGIATHVVNTKSPRYIALREELPQINASHSTVLLPFARLSGSGTFEFSAKHARAIAVESAGYANETLLLIFVPKGEL